MSAALRQIIEILAGSQDFQLRVRAAELGAQTRFKEDLGFDSLAVMSLAYELAEHYPDLDEMEIANWVTLGDCASYVEGLSSV